MRRKQAANKEQPNKSINVARKGEKSTVAPRCVGADAMGRAGRVSLPRAGADSLCSGMGWSGEDVAS